MITQPVSTDPPILTTHWLTPKSYQEPVSIVFLPLFVYSPSDNGHDPLFMMFFAEIFGELKILVYLCTIIIYKRYHLDTIINE